MSREESQVSKESRFLFFKPEGFYRVVIPEATLDGCIKDNPTTLRVIDVHGVVVWTRAQGYLTPRYEALRQL